MPTPPPGTRPAFARRAWSRLQRPFTLRSFLLPCLVAGAAQAQDWPQISLSSYASGFSFPVHIAHAGDGTGRLFVVELGGRIKIVKDGVVQATPFLDIVGRPGCSQGLLSVAFPPDFATKRHFYVNYTDQTTCALVVSRFTVGANPDIADANSEQRILTIDNVYSGTAIFHSGGELAFGPDGYLYFGIGDGDTGADPGDLGNYAQNLNSLRGKILRLDVETGNPTTYTIPATNPFAAGGGLPEIWAVGVRNPFRSSFDRLSGEYYIADVGQNAFEEVNVQPPGVGGLNYGWPIMEGFNCHSPSTGCNQAGLTLPVAGYVNARSVSDCSITGGRVYRGSAYPRMNGVYFYGDYCSGNIWGLRKTNNTWQSTQLRSAAVSSEGIVSFGEDEGGNVYVTDRVLGVVYKIADSVTNAAPVAAAQSLSTNEDTPLNITLAATDANGDPLTYTIASSPSQGSLTGTGAARTYTPNANYSGNDSFVFTASDGSAESSATVWIAVIAINDPPLASDDAATTRRNKSVTVAVLANDHDPDGDGLTVTSVTQPSDGTAAITKGRNSVQFTPARNFVGTCSFTYTISDGKGGSATATVSVTVTK